MRALILLLCAAIVVLAVSIVLHIDARPALLRRGPTFDLGALLANAGKGEQAVYRERTSLQRMRYLVEDAPRLPPFVAPHKRIRRELQGPRGEPAPGGEPPVSYDHRITEHGWFPLMAPGAPDALDRVWIVRAIETDTVAVGAVQVPCWRVDLIDPALPDGADTVVAWLDAAVPVFGLLKWKRAGQTWEFQGTRETP